MADVDGDGCDEILVGSCLVDHDGKALWTLGIGHPDTCYVGKVDPQRPGLRIYTTTIPADTRRTCLMQDRLYRLYVATNSMELFKLFLRGRLSLERC